MYLVLFSGQKYQTYRGGWEGSVWLQDIFSLFCVLCIIIVAVYQPQLWSTHWRARARACVLKVYVLWGKSCVYSALEGSSNLVGQYFTTTHKTEVIFVLPDPRFMLSN